MSNFSCSLIYHDQVWHGWRGREQHSIVCAGKSCGEARKAESISPAVAARRRIFEEGCVMQWQLVSIGSVGWWEIRCCGYDVWWQCCSIHCLQFAGTFPCSQYFCESFHCTLETASYLCFILHLSWKVFELFEGGYPVW